MSPTLTSAFGVHGDGWPFAPVDGAGKWPQGETLGPAAPAAERGTIEQMALALVGDAPEAVPRNGARPGLRLTEPA